MEYGFTRVEDALITDMLNYRVFSFGRQDDGLIPHATNHRVLLVVRHAMRFTATGRGLSDDSMPGLNAIK